MIISKLSGSSFPERPPAPPEEKASQLFERKGEKEYTFSKLAGRPRDLSDALSPCMATYLVTRTGNIMKPVSGTKQVFIHEERH